MNLKVKLSRSRSKSGVVSTPILQLQRTLHRDVHGGNPDSGLLGDFQNDRNANKNKCLVSVALWRVDDSTRLIRCVTPAQRKAITHVKTRTVRYKRFVMFLSSRT